MAHLQRVIAGSKWQTTALAVAVGSVLWSGIVVLAIFQPAPVLGALIAASAALVIFRYPILVMSFLFFIQPFNAAIASAVKSQTGLSPGPFEYWKDIVIVALFVRALIERFVKDRRPPIHNPGDNVMLFYVLAFVAIAVASPARPTVVPALGRYIEGPLLLLAIRWLRPSRKELWVLVAALLGAAAIMGTAALVEWFGPRLAFQRWYGVFPPPSGEPFLLPSGGYRAGSFISDPLILGFYLAAALPFATSVSSIRSRWRGAAVVAVGACAGGLIVTLTRSGYIGGAIGTLVVLALTVRNPGIRLSMVGIVVVIVGTISIYYVASNNQDFIRTESNSGHVERLTRDVELIVARPLGYGLGTTDRYRFRPDVDQGQLGSTENTFLARGLESGIQGLGLYLLALFVLVMRLRSVRVRARSREDSERALLAAGAIGTITALALAGLFLGVQELVVEILLWSVPGIALAWPAKADGTHEKIEDGEPTVAHPRGSKRAME